MSGSTRRQFLVHTALLGGSLIVGVSFAGRKPEGDAWEFTPWICIAPDDVVTVRVPTPEVGNGVMTQIPMTVSEELNCDWTKVRAEFAPSHRDLMENRVYSTPGGVLAYFSGRSTGPERTTVLLQAGASARERLRAAAAQRWSVPVSEVSAASSVLTHTPTGRALRYGEVAAAAASIKLATEPKPKDPKDWTVLGKHSRGKLNNPAIVTGTATYGIDVRQPNMLYAALTQSPVHGGKLVRFDFEAILKMPGVRGIAVVDPTETRRPLSTPMPFPVSMTLAQSGIAVVADHYWQARKALEALPLEWSDGEGARWKNQQQIYRAAIAALETPATKVNVSRGDDVDAALAGAGTKVDATYITPYCDQAALEPLNGTAMVTPERVDVWHPSQHSQQAHMVAAEEAGVTPEKVYFHQTFVGGAFGRRVPADDARMVVAVAKKFPGRPVHVIWSREETMRQGRYRPMQVARLSAVLGENGLPKAVLVRVAGSDVSARGFIQSAYFDARVIPNLRAQTHTLPLHVLTGSYRGPGYNSHAFMVETFIEECAAAARIDALEYRLRLLEHWPDKGWSACLREVAKQHGWGKPLPPGQGMGLAIGNWGMTGPSTGTTLATAVTVQVSDGMVKVLKVDVAFDCGTVLNPDAVRAQVEGGTLFGLNMTMNEELSLENGRIVEGNFDTYPMLRIGDVPEKINVHFAAVSGHPRMSEVGEPPVGPIGPALGAAIFRATGKRLRTTPFRKHDLREA